MNCISKCCAIVALCSCTLEAQTESSIWYAEHQNNQGRYFNPWQVEGGPSLWGLIRAYTRTNPYSGVPEPEVPLAIQDYLPDPGSEALVTWLGHATVAIQDQGDLILTDPNFNDNTGVYRRHSPPGIPLEQLPAPSFGVISHNHYDHLDKPSILALPKDTIWLVPAGLGEWFEAQNRNRVIELDWWQSQQINDWTVTCVPVQHWSLRLGQPRNSTLWCGWILESRTKTYFFAGDTGYFDGFVEIGKRFPDIDVAMLPIGSYAPREFLAYQHMDPADALRAFDDLGAKHMLPIHWGAFHLTQEPPGEPAMELRRAMKSSEADARRIHILPIGGSLKP